MQTLPGARETQSQAMKSTVFRERLLILISGRAAALLSAGQRKQLLHSVWEQHAACPAEQANTPRCHAVPVKVAVKTQTLWLLI